MYRAGLTDLQAVMAVSRRGSFRAAAIDLGSSATAFSHTIAKLESGLGVRLFNRTTRSVPLTDAGRLFVEGVGPALQDIDVAIEAVRSQRHTPSGLLRVNVAANAAHIVLSLVVDFLRLYPDMEVDIVTEGRLVDIVAEGFDFGVRVAGLVPRDMISISLGPAQRFAVIGSPEYFADTPAPSSPADLVNHRCLRVRLPNGRLYHWRFEQNGDVVEVDVQGPLTLDEGHLTRAAALAGLGLGFLHEHFVLPDIKQGRLVRVLADWTPPSPRLCLYYPGRRNLSAGLKAFISLARKSA